MDDKSVTFLSDTVSLIGTHMLNRDRPKVATMLLTPKLFLQIGLAWDIEGAGDVNDKVQYAHQGGNQTLREVITSRCPGHQARTNP